MIKDLIDLELGNPIAVLIEDNQLEKLNIDKLVVNVSSDQLFDSTSARDFVFHKLSQSKGDINYLIFKGIDKLSSLSQIDLIGLIKDRKFEGKDLPKNVIIITTIRHLKSVQSLNKELIKFLVQF